jgi:hypothetical protein
MTTSHTPITNTNAVNTIRTRATAVLANLDAGRPVTADDIRQMAADIATLAADSDHWYAQADRFRESYRLAKGLTGDELNAQAVIDEATRAHRPPCRFPFSPGCDCPETPAGA